MQIDRLIQIVLILGSQKSITASELARRLNVSARTVYRDIDALSLAGIPVYALKGSGGGIRLMEGYTLDRAILSEREKQDIVYALQGLMAANVPGVGETLAKIKLLLQAPSQPDWIEVRFTPWETGACEQKKFDVLKEALLSKRVLAFDYYAVSGSRTTRLAEPVKLVFSGRTWYLWAFCRQRQDYRLFRVSRIRNERLSEERFEREAPQTLPQDSGSANNVTLKLRFKRSVAFRVYDDFLDANILDQDEASLVVAVTYPMDEWVIGYLLSFGTEVEVLEPAFIRERLKARAKEIYDAYL